VQDAESHLLEKGVPRVAELNLKIDNDDRKASSKEQRE
jgi:hypothetical protein